MLQTILQLYTTSLAADVRTPVPHLFGPPGSGKSTFVEQAADILGVNLHTINVSRISPLELEGVQMPTEGKLELLLSTYWNALQEGDILLFDEFLRGFPEVYNGLLDIFTSRRVAGHVLPKVFIIAASNSTTAYDSALTDRLLHLPVPDVRKNTAEHKRIAAELVKAIGLHPHMVGSYSMDSLINSTIAPMYNMLDSLKGALATTSSEGASPRNLIGQAKLRYVTSSELASVIEESNRLAEQKGHWQYLILYRYNGRLCQVHPDYLKKVSQLLQGDQLSDLQRVNAGLNLNLYKAEQQLKEVV